MHFALLLRRDHDTSRVPSLSRRLISNVSLILKFSSSEYTFSYSPLHEPTTRCASRVDERPLGICQGQWTQNMTYISPPALPLTEPKKIGNSAVQLKRQICDAEEGYAWRSHCCARFLPANASNTNMRVPAVSCEFFLTTCCSAAWGEIELSIGRYDIQLLGKLCGPRQLEFECQQFRKHGNTVLHALEERAVRSLLACTLSLSLSLHTADALLLLLTGSRFHQLREGTWYWGT